MSSPRSCGPSPDTGVLAWLDSHPPPNLFTTAVTEAEIRAGIAVLPAGRRRTGLLAAAEQAFPQPVLRSRFTIRQQGGSRLRRHSSRSSRRRSSNQPAGLPDCRYSPLPRRVCRNPGRAGIRAVRNPCDRSVGRSAMIRRNGLIPPTTPTLRRRRPAIVSVQVPDYGQMTISRRRSRSRCASVRSTGSPQPPPPPVFTRILVPASTLRPLALRMRVGA